MEASPQDDDDEKSSSSPRQLAANKSATNGGGERQTRPYVQALQALERLTAESGAQHHAAESADSSAQSSTHHPPSAFGTGDDDYATSYGKEGPPGPSTSSDTVPGKCRVSFDMVRLLAGPDGIDAMGRPVGVSPGQDMEAAVLSGGEQVWIFNTTIASLVVCRDSCPYRKQGLEAQSSTRVDR